MQFCFYLLELCIQLPEHCQCQHFQNHPSASLVWTVPREVCGVWSSAPTAIGLLEGVGRQLVVCKGGQDLCLMGDSAKMGWWRTIFDGFTWYFSKKKDKMGGKGKRTQWGMGIWPSKRSGCHFRNDAVPYPRKWKKWQGKGEFFCLWKMRSLNRRGFNQYMQWVMQQLQ